MKSYMMFYVLPSGRKCRTEIKANTSVEALTTFENVFPGSYKVCFCTELPEWDNEEKSI